MAKDTARTREDEWFLRHEKDLIEQIRRERERKLREEMEKRKKKELEELRKKHWMKCPKCGHDMVVETIEGIEIDKCTYCEGIFFDRGELEDLLLRVKEKRSFFRKLLGFGAD